MIPLSPLQLKSHSFTHIVLRARQNGSADAPVVLEPLVHCQPDANDEKLWHMVLTLRLEDASPDKPFVYEAEVQVVGVAEIRDVVQPDKREQIIRVNGMSLLFSAAREMLLNLSARSVHGPLSLPVVNFNELFGNPTAEPSQVSVKLAKARKPRLEDTKARPVR